MQTSCPAAIAVTAVSLGKKGEVNAIDDADLVGFDHDAIDHRAEDFAACVPIGLLKIRCDRGGESVQASQCLAQGRLFACLVLLSVKLLLDLFQAFSGTRDARFELAPFHHAVGVGVDETIDGLLSLGELVRQ